MRNHSTCTLVSAQIKPQETESEREREREHETTKVKRSQAGRAPLAEVPSPTQRGRDDGRPQKQGTRCQPSRHPGRHCRMSWLGFGTAMRPICLTYQNTREGHRFLGTGGRSRPLVIQSGSSPRFTKRNAIFRGCWPLLLQ